MMISRFLLINARDLGGFARSQGSGWVAVLLLAAVGALVAVAAHQRGGNGWLAAGAAWGFLGIAEHSRSSTAGLAGATYRGRGSISFAAEVMAGVALLSWLIAALERHTAAVVTAAAAADSDRERAGYLDFCGTSCAGGSRGSKPRKAYQHDAPEFAWDKGIDWDADKELHTWGEDVSKLSQQKQQRQQQFTKTSQPLT